MKSKTLYTVGYGKWTTAKRMEKLIAALESAGVNTLIDIRHAPCSSQLPPTGSKNYWPKPWNLQPSGDGIVSALNAVGIEYRWIVELGNPQKNDRAMSMMREHLLCEDGMWPVNRGIDLLQQLLIDDPRVCCLLCACKTYGECHRKLVAEAALKMFPEGLFQIEDLSK